MAGLFLIPTLAAPLADAQGSGGVRLVPIRPFDDVLFSNVDGAFDATVDPATGEIWYTTGGGLVHMNRDGTARRVLGVADGLPSPLLYTLRFASDGALWVGSDAGLVRVDPRTSAMRYWNPENEPRATAFIVTYVQPAADGSVWVGTHQKGIGRFWPATGAWDGPWNTSATRNDPVVNGGESPTGPVFAARSSGFLRWDAPNATFAPVEEPEAYALQSATAYAYAAGASWYGTDAGLWRHDPSNATGPWKRFMGETLSDIRVTDLDLRGDKLWISTKTGVTVLNLTNEDASYLGRGAGLVSNNVRRSYFDGSEQALFATLDGLTQIDFARNVTSNFVTGERNGPNSNSLLGGAEHAGRVWFASTDGASAFDPARQDWLSLGIVDGLDRASLPVYDLVSDGPRLWMATRKFVWMYDDATREWTSVRDDVGTNFYYHLDVDGDTLWLPEYGTGLVEFNWRTNATRRYDVSNSGLLEWLVRDAKATDSSVYVATVSGLYRLDKTTRIVQPTPYGTPAGFPTYEMERLWKDGKDLWVAHTASGVSRFSTATNTVVKTYNATLGNLPGNDVRDLVRDRSFAWMALGADGLARVNVATGEVKHWTMANGLPESHANGLVLKDGILYVSTHGGIARLDTTTLAFLPMHVADPSKWLVENPSPEPSVGAPAASYPPHAKITFPVTGTAVTGRLVVEGQASKPGGAIDRVEVAIGNGPWRAAEGTGDWAFEVDTGAYEGEIQIRARAIAGNETSKEDLVSVTVVDAPKQPLAIRHTPPLGHAFAGRTVPIAAEVSGDPPLRATLNYEPAGSGAYKSLPLERRGTLWVAEIPADDAKPGELRYFIEASSGPFTRTLPEDRAHPFTLKLERPPDAAVAIEAPERVDVRPGERVAFRINVTNLGRSADNYALLATGLRASWVTLDSASFRLGPGERAEREVVVTAPERAFANNATLTFTVKPLASAAEPATATVPLRVTSDAAVAAAPDSATGEGGGFWAWLKRIPGPEPALALAALALVALAARRRNTP